MTFQSFTLGTILRWVAILVFGVAIILYVLFQARHVLTGPTITFHDVYEPVIASPVVTIDGVGENIVKLTINGRAITTDTSGVFSDTIVLPNGLSRVRIEGTDRFGRTTVHDRAYVYKNPDTAQTDPLPVEYPHDP